MKYELVNNGQEVVLVDSEDYEIDYYREANLHNVFLDKMAQQDDWYPEAAVF